MKKLLSCLPALAASLALLLAMPCPASAQQHLRLIDGEMVTCKITVMRPAINKTGATGPSSSRSKRLPGPMEPKTFEPLLNQAGSFDRLADIHPGETVEVELSYPEGKTGEQVAVSVEDGGGINKEQKVGVYHLDNAGKFSFSFTTGEAAGLYRLAARKEFETRIVQLWVGPEIMPVGYKAVKSDKE